MNIQKYNLQKRIIIMLSIASLFIVVIFSLISFKIYNNYEEEVFGKESINTLHSLDSSIQSVIKTADNYSKMLIADATVQKQMSTGNLNEDTKGQQNVINIVYSILQFSETMDSIWFIDNCDQKLSIGGYATRATDIDDSNYEELRTPYGRAKVLLESHKGQTFLSLVRSYNNTTDFSSVGIIGVEISEKHINSIVSRVIDNNTDKIFIVDDQNQVIFSNDYEEAEQYLNIIDHQTFDNDDFQDVNIMGTKMLFTGIKCADRNWRILRFTQLPLKNSGRDLLQFNLVMLIILGILILIGSSFLANLFTKPITQMLAAMGNSENMNPSKVENSPALEEFRELFSGYNKMVDRIEQLIQETIKRQERIRQVELNEIQEQMKPHFLYNTLDSIEALAMIGDTDSVCKLIEALGGFYRKSVSGGRQFISIQEEIQMAEDYVKIMKIRFGDTFKCDISFDPDCKQYLIPKLTIQPLVENAFQHGIRGQQEFGYIEVKVYQDNSLLHIIVNDTGKGIPTEVIEEIRNSINGEKGRLGLRGTIQRLSLMYGDAFSYDIGKDGASMIHMYLSIDSLKVENNE